MRVNNCNVTSKSAYQQDDEIHLIFHVVAHVKRTCEALCFSGSKIYRKMIEVLGKYISFDCYTYVKLYVGRSKETMHAKDTNLL